jgi:hypothetical protein
VSLRRNSFRSSKGRCCSRSRCNGILHQLIVLSSDLVVNILRRDIIVVVGDVNRRNCSNFVDDVLHEGSIMPVGCPEHSERKEKACKHCDIGKLVVVFTNCERCDCESVQAFTKPKGKMYSKKVPVFAQMSQ